MSDLLWQKPGVAVDAEIQRFLAGDDVSWTAGWAEGAVTTALNAVSSMRA